MSKVRTFGFFADVLRPAPPPPLTLYACVGATLASLFLCPPLFR
jgi:hypothetical protein